MSTNENKTVTFTIWQVAGSPDPEPVKLEKAPEFTHPVTREHFERVAKHFLSDYFSWEHYRSMPGMERSNSLEEDLPLWDWLVEFLIEEGRTVVYNEIGDVLYREFEVIGIPWFLHYLESDKWDRQDWKTQSEKEDYEESVRDLERLEAYVNKVRNLNQAVDFLRKPYMDDSPVGLKLEHLLRKKVAKHSEFVNRPYAEELTEKDQAKLWEIFGEYDNSHADIMRIIKG